MSGKKARLRRDRTCDQPVRNRLLYATELQAHWAYSGAKCEACNAQSEGRSG